ncbi:MAG TPA: class I SAM-dependent methyltransferase [Gemmatimonadaceae bacterium]|nr:class I SAM-dependent methyltransferase [Gemmatimonadaceae bacterium]
MADGITDYDDVDEIGELYDHVPLYEKRRDVDFYVDEALAMDGNILELGCGTGRVLFPMARRGKQITGVDNSARMLARCRERLAGETAEVRSKVTLVKADMRAFNLDAQFSTVLLPFRPLQHLVAVSDQIAMLQRVHKHLEPGGRLMFDVFNPNPTYLVQDRTAETEDTPEVELPDRRTFRRTGRVAAVHIVEQYSEIELIYYVRGVDGSEQRLVHGFLMRWFWRHELEHLLARCGFRTKAVFGDFNRSPLTDKSPEMIFIAERI